MAGATVRFGQLCDLIADPVRPGARPDAMYLGLEHIAPGRLVRISCGQASNMRSNTSAFLPGDVLYGKLRPYLDKAVLSDEAGVCTTELLVLRPKEDVDPRFLAALVHSPSFLEYAIAGTTGVQHPRTSWAHIREYEAPALSLSEQQKLADLVWLVHEGISQSEKLVEEAHALKRAAMQTLFTCSLQGEAQKQTEIGPMPESWELSPLGTICKGTDSVDLRSEGNRIIEYVDVSSISREYLQIETTSRHILKEAPGRARKRILSGDVIFATVRPTLLRTAIISEKFDNQVCSTAFCVLRHDQNKTVDRFIYYLVQRDQFLQQLGEIETGASYPAVTDRMVKEQIVPVPHIDEQHEIVAVLNAIDRKIDLHHRKHAVLEELFKTMLHKLMLGEIGMGELDLTMSPNKLLPDQGHS